MLTIDYKLTGSGWAECTIADGEQTCTVTASYLADAFGDLVLAAVAQLHWFDSLSFSFREEPGEFRWVFTSGQQHPDDIDLKILDPYDRYEGKPGSEGRLLFHTVCDRRDFAKAVQQVATKLLADYGEAGYLEKWVEYPFPTESLNELNRLLSRFTYVRTD